MKKLLSVLLAMTTIFCLAGCADGKCDDCETNRDVVEYKMSDGDTAEYCPLCAVKHALDIRGTVDD